MGVAVATVTRAYSEAERLGLVVGEVGRGTYIAEPPPGLAATHGQGAIDMTINRPPNEGAARQFANALRALSKRRDLADLLGIEPPNGWHRHRAAAAKWMRNRGVVVQPEQVVACNGVQHALSVILSAFTQPGDLIATEYLNYPGIRLLGDLHRLRLAGVAMDHEGLDVDQLERLCRRERVRLVICSPTAHNPTTVTLSQARRTQLADLARKHDLIIVENDVLGMMPLQHLPAISVLAPERTCYVTGLTKIVAAGFRLAFVSASQRLIERLTKAVHGTTWMPPPLLLEMFTLWMDDGVIDEVIAWHRLEIEARISSARRVLAGAVFSWDPSAYHLWLQLPDSSHALDFVNKARSEGVLVVPGSTFAVNTEAAGTNGVRISLGGQNDRRRVEQGLSRVRDILADLRTGPVFRNHLLSVDQWLSQQEPAQTADTGESCA
jgi:DNA-binding transcriptional MocR family regulator